MRAKLAILLLLSLWRATAFAACASPVGVAGEKRFFSLKFMSCDGTTWKDTSNGVLSSCAGTPAGTMNYNAGLYRFCDGTNWNSMKGTAAGSCAGTPAGTLTASSGAYRFCDGTTWYNTEAAPAAGSPPTYVGTYSIGYNNLAPVTSGSFGVQAGDLLVVYGTSEAANTVMNISGGSLTWTTQQDIGANNGNYADGMIWTAIVDVNKSMTFTINANSQRFGGTLTIWRNHGGIGAVAGAISSGAPSLTITTQKANSALVVADGDWNAVNGGTRAWRTTAGAFTEVTYENVSGSYVTYGGYHANVGAAGAKVVGLTLPTGQLASLVAIEIKGP